MPGMILMYDLVLPSKNYNTIYSHILRSMDVSYFRNMSGAACYQQNTSLLANLVYVT